MKIGILHEGKLDLASLKIIINKIISSVDDSNIFYSYKSNGEVITKMRPATAYFKEEDVDLIIFISDIDTYPERRRYIKDYIKENSHLNIVPAFCDPHFEEWFIAEKEALSHILGVNYESSISNHEYRSNPKKLIDILINEKMKRDQDTLFKSDIYENISKRMNIDSLSLRNSDFKHFKEDLKKIIKNKYSK